MEVSETDRFTIRSVVEQQLQAFQRNDAQMAFSFASPAIQAQFGTPERFLDMVKTSYFAVYRPRSILFQAIANVDGYPAQQVIIMHPDGHLIRALYLMQRQPDGNWRIHGCFLMPLEESAP